MVAENRHTDPHNNLDLPSLNQPTLLPNSYLTFVYRLEILLIIFLLVYGIVVLASNNNPLIVFGTLGLLSLNLVARLFYKRTHPTVRLLSAWATLILIGFITLSAIDKSQALIAWFYLFIVYYSFLLRSPHQYIYIGAHIFVFSIVYFATSYDAGMGEFFAHVTLLLGLSTIMSMAQTAVHKAIIDRNRLLDELRQARDHYADQLKDRTTELEKEVQERKQAEEKLAQEHLLLQTVIDSFPSRLYVKDRQSRFTLVNRKSLENIIQKYGTEEIIGKSDFDFYPHIAERTYTAEQHLMETGIPITDLQQFVIEGDSARYYLINKVPMRDPQSDEIVGLVGVTTDVTSLQETQDALEESQEWLRLFQSRLKAINQITLNLNHIKTFDELVYQSIRQGIDQLGFSRLNCWFIGDRNDQLIGAYRVNLDGEIVSSQHEVMSLSNTLNPVKKILDGELTNYVVYDTPIYDIDMNEIGHGDKAFTALLDSDKVIGCLYIDNYLDKQPLTNSQIELLNLYGATLGVLFNRHRAQEALQAREQQARDFQQLLKTLNEVTLELESVYSLNELCKQAVLLGRDKLGFDRLGIWLTIDDQPELYQGTWGTDKDGNLVDEHMIQLPIPEPQLSMLAEGEVVLVENIIASHVDGGELSVGWALLGIMWDGVQRIGWVSADNALTNEPLSQNQYELFRLYVATLGVLINRQHIQDDLRIREEEARNFQQQLKQLNEVTLSLETTHSLNELCRQAVLLGREKLGFERLGIWLTVEDDPDKRRGMWGTTADGTLCDERNRVVQIPEVEMQMVKDQEVIVVHNTRMYDYDELTKTRKFLNEGWLLIGLMWDGGKRLGWVYADAAITGQDLTQNRIELFRLYVATLGVLVNRFYAQDALQASEQEARNFQQQLKRLNEVALSLEAADSLNDLCRQAVLLGREKLDFERVGIWLTVEDNPHQRQGTWGIDMQGQLRDERELIVDIAEDEKEIFSGNDIITLQNTSIYDYDDGNWVYIRDGWFLGGLMWDGTKQIGRIFADNALTGKPLSPNQQELFRLYVATITLLCTNQMADDLLRKREIRYRAITEASSDIICIVNRDMIVTYISASLNVMMGVDPEVIVGRSVFDAVHRDDVPEIKSVLQECMIYPGLHTRINEFRMRHADGHWVQMEAVMTSQINEPVINGVLVSCRDLTQRLIAEEGKRIVEQERQRALVLRQFIGDISHDFRTPLSTIATTAFLIKNGKKNNIEQRVEMIDQQIERLANLIDNLNTITKLDGTSEIVLHKININNILQSISYYQSDLVAKKQLNIKLDLQWDLPTITGNESLLQEAIYHLIDNSMQFCQEYDSIIVQSYQDQESVVVQIADTGVGISEADLPFIFDRLYRADKSRNTHTGGSGLGLAITRRIIDLHQGTIKVTSQLDEGTLVYIELPQSI